MFVSVNCLWICLLRCLWTWSVDAFADVSVDVVVDVCVCDHPLSRSLLVVSPICDTTKVVLNRGWGVSLGLRQRSEKGTLGYGNPLLSVPPSLFSTEGAEKVPYLQATDN